MCSSDLLMNGFSEFGEFDHVIKDLVKFIESIDYQGFGEFDLKYDERDGKYKVFEINPRQSRSGYYLPALGYNYVQLLVDDLIHDKPMEQKIVLDEILLSFVP